MFFLQNVLSFTSTNSSQNPTAPVTEYCFRLRLSDSFFFWWRLPQKNVSHNGLPVQRHSRLRRGPLLTCSSGVRLKSLDNANHWTLTESKLPKYLLERLELSWSLEKITQSNLFSCRKPAIFLLDVHFALLTLFQWSLSEVTPSWYVLLRVWRGDHVCNFKEPAGLPRINHAFKISYRVSRASQPTILEFQICFMAISEFQNLFLYVFFRQLVGALVKIIIPAVCSVCSSVFFDMFSISFLFLWLFGGYVYSGIILKVNQVLMSDMSWTKSAHHGILLSQPNAGRHHQCQGGHKHLGFFCVWIHHKLWRNQNMNCKE